MCGIAKPPGSSWTCSRRWTAPTPRRTFSHLTVVVDNAKIHQAAEVEKWLAAHPRFELLYLPTYCPRANPIERAFGDVHDKCTRNHTRKRMWHLVQDVKQHLQVNGPWRYALSEIYYTPEVTAAVEALRAAAHRTGRDLTTCRLSVPMSCGPI